MRDGVLAPVEVNLLKHYSRSLSDEETGKELIMLNCKRIDVGQPHFAGKLTTIPPDQVDVEHVLWIPYQFILVISDISDEHSKPIGFT